jgi:hypothetical protein
MSDRRIEVLFFDGCPNAAVALDRARDASKTSGVSSTVTAVRVLNETEALRLRFLGSPTIRVDAQDVDPGASVRDDFGMQCRIYLVGGRLEGAPPVEWITAALRDGRPRG